MRITRLYTPGSLTSGTDVSIDGKAAHHVLHVLRLRTGASLRVFNGDGNEFDAVLAGTGRTNVILEIGNAVQTLPEPCLRIRLAQGIARHDRMDLILQKSVELGIGEIQPLWMQRSQSHLRGSRLEKRVRHWQGIISSACEQCGRAILPVLHAPLPYSEWINAPVDDGLRLILQPNAKQTLAGLPAPPGSITLLVGPEGGMDKSEQHLAISKDFIGLRLGARILRTETAALAVLSGIQALWGDFR